MKFNQYQKNCTCLERSAFDTGAFQNSVPCREIVRCRVSVLTAKIPLFSCAWVAIWRHAHVSIHVFGELSVERREVRVSLSAAVCARLSLQRCAHGGYVCMCTIVHCGGANTSLVCVCIYASGEKITVSSLCLANPRWRPDFGFDHREKSFDSLAHVGCWDGVGSRAWA